MDLRIKQLIEKLEQYGWEFKGPADVKSDWWFENIYLLTSTWSPLHRTLYLTLLTDPQCSDSKQVWAVSISGELPDRDNLNPPLKEITLNDFKRTNLDHVVREINSIVLNP